MQGDTRQVTGSVDVFFRAVPAGCGEKIVDGGAQATQIGGHG